jgi:hypothetical protein
MKPQAIKQYLYSGDYYSYRLITSADGTVTTKQYVTAPEEVSMLIQTNIFGELKIDSLYKMQRESILKNIKDKNNEEIYENGVWEIIQSAPILSPMGTKEGYQYIAILKSGDI